MSCWRWADAAVALPGAEDHRLYPVALGVVAYGGFVRGDLDPAIETGERAVAAATRLGVPTMGLAERAMGNAHFYRDRPVEADAWADRMIEEAIALEAPGPVAHAYYMRSVAATSVGDSESGAALAQLSTSAAIESGSPTANAQAAYALGLSFETRDPAQALRLLDRSVQHAEKVDNRWIRSFALTESLWIRARSGEAQAALRGYHNVIDTWFRGGDWANQWLSLRYVFAIFETLEHDEVAATLHGALENAGAMRALPIGPGTADELGRALDRLTKRLGTSKFAEAAERRRTMRDEEVVRYALAAITAATDPEPA